MSIQALNWVLERSESSGNARCVLFSIANHADREGTNAFPMYETIAIESRCSRATVNRMLRELKAAGEVDWISGIGDEGSRRKSNLYWLPKMRSDNGLPATPTTSQSETLSKTTRSQTETPSFPTRSQSRRDKVSNRSRQGLNGETRTKSIRPEPKTGVHAEGRKTDADGPGRRVFRETKQKLDRELRQLAAKKAMP